MPITVKCPCGFTTQAPDEFAGKKTKCPKCQAALVIPVPQPGGLPDLDDIKLLDEPAFQKGPPAPQPAKSRPGKKPVEIEIEGADLVDDVVEDIELDERTPKKPLVPLSKRPAATPPAAKPTAAKPAASSPAAKQPPAAASKQPPAAAKPAPAAAKAQATKAAPADRRQTFLDKRKEEREADQKAGKPDPFARREKPKADEAPILAEIVEPVRQARPQAREDKPVLLELVEDAEQVGSNGKAGKKGKKRHRYADDQVEEKRPLVAISAGTAAGFSAICGAGLWMWKSLNEEGQIEWKAWILLGFGIVLVIRGFLGMEEE
jgi:hypothetical protein